MNPRASFLRDALLATTSALLVVGAYLVSEAFPPPPAPWPDEAVRAALDQRIAGEVRIRDSVREAVEQLAELGAPIDAHWSERWMKQEGRAEVDLCLRDATVRQWLDAIDVTLGGEQIGYWIGLGDRVNVSGWMNQHPPVVLHAYDVRDLLAEAEAFSSTFPVYRPWFADSEDVDASAAAHAALEEWVKQSTRSWTWWYFMTGNPPAFGRVDFVDGRMIVLQTPVAQREIQVVLAALRAGQRGKSGRGE